MRSHAITCDRMRSHAISKKNLSFTTVQVLENASGTRSGTESLPKVFLHDNCEQISFIVESKSRGEIVVFTWVLLGERVVESYNAYQVDEEKHIRLVITISKSSL